MRDLQIWLRRYYRSLVGSIGFWPAILAAGFVAVAVAMRAFATESLFTEIEELAPYLLVRDRTVALNLLTTLIGALISLTVFSFSMVMVLLSNATANLTPRLLPSLIESRRHQVVLGVYLGTILYCIVIAMGYGLGTSDGQPPSASLSLAILLGIACLALFIYFIHGVSVSIQVGKVLLRTYERAEASLAANLARAARHEHAYEIPDVSTWTAFESPESGFFRGMSAQGLAHRLQGPAAPPRAAIVLAVTPGSFVLAGECLAHVSPGVIAGHEIERHIFLGPVGDVDDDYAYDVEQPTEVALKALSPGINDPGTAVIAVRYIERLLIRAMMMRPVRVTTDADGTPRVYEPLTVWWVLLDRHFGALAHYGADDPYFRVAARSAIDDLARHARKCNAPAEAHTILDRLLGAFEK